MNLALSAKLWGSLALANSVVLGVQLFRHKWFLNEHGELWPHDFLSLWAAAVRSWQGQAALSYNWEVHIRFQQMLLDAPAPINLGFFHPPHFLFILFPFGLLPFLVAQILFLATTAILYIAALKSIVKDVWVAAAMALSLGAATYSLWWVQIGFLVAALLVGGMVLLRRHPLLAGILFGILTIKPQLGLVVALALLLSKAWKAIGSAVATAAVLALGAEICFGPEIWPAFIASTEVSSKIMITGGVGLKAQSIYAMAHPFLGTVGAAAVHAIVACAALVIFAKVWRSPAPFNVRAAAVIPVSLLVTPYLFAYDAVMLTGAAAFLLTEKSLTSKWEKAAIVGATILPSLSSIILSPAVPLASFLMLYSIVRLVGRIDRKTSSIDISAAAIVIR